jgi:hypothetical protein
VGYVTTNELKNEIETLSEFAVDSFKHKSEIDTHFKMCGIWGTAT